MIIRHAISLMLVVILAVVLTACSSNVKNSEPPRKLVVHLLADPNINPNAQWQASPIVIQIYQLKSVDLFNQADFFSLYLSADKTLGDSKITSTNVIVMPGEDKTITLPLDQNTKWFGVVAAYSKLNNAHWSAVTPMNSSWGKEKLSVHIQQFNLTVNE